MLYVDIKKKLDSFVLDIHIETDNEMTGIFGASGSGKSMTLKCIAGIEKPDSGMIKLNDRVLFDSEKRINLRPQERKVGYLFQEYALFPNMSVRGNIIAGLHRLPRKERKAQADKLMEGFRISHLSDKKPDSLSGGERQRVALARLFASSPEFILLDEPFSSLDTTLKYELIPMMKQAVTDYGKGCLMVSHDINELCAVCSKATVISGGANNETMTAADLKKEIEKKYESLGITI